MRPNARDPKAGLIAWFLAFLAVGLLIAYLNRWHVEQQSNYDIYVAMAEHYLGNAQRSVLTYPLWGYPFVLLLIRRYDLIAIPQVVLGTVAMTALFVRVRSALPEHRTAVAILFLAAIPWYLLHSVKWPLSFAASFSMLATVLLERAIRTNSVRLGCGAGILFGIALYFRSEFLYLPLFIVVVAVLSRSTRRLPAVPLWPVATCAITAWAVLIPWALHYHQQTGHFSLTASQRGIVAYISLGQLPRNPWGAVYEDEYAYAYLNENAPHLTVNSDPADRLLVEEFTRRVKAHPGAFAAKMVWNGGVSLVSGFYGGEIPLSAEQTKQFLTIKRRPWSAVVPALTGRGDLHADGRTRVAFLYWLVAKSTGSLLVILGVAGIVFAVWRGVTSPLMFLLAATIVYQWLLFMGLSTEPRYKNGLYLYFVPFILLAWQTGASRWRPRVYQTQTQSVVQQGDS